MFAASTDRDRMVIIDSESDPRAWTVYHAQERRTIHNVLWVDTERAIWCETAGVSYFGAIVSKTHQADKIEVDVQELRIVINPGKWPEVPFEVHNRTPVDSQRAIDAVRPLCEGYRA